MSRAFDTIDRAKLMSILDTVPGLTDDDRRLIRVLLANTSIQVNFNGVVTAPFTSTIGSPQGDALSPILFAIYLEAAIRELIARGPKRPQCDLNIHLPLEAIYADDTDFGLLGSAAPVLTYKEGSYSNTEPSILPRCSALANVVRSRKVQTSNSRTFAKPHA